MQESIAHVARYWWLIALRGVLAIVFGILAIVWPSITLAVLILFFGAYMFVDGAFALVGAIRFRHQRERWMPLLLEAILGLVVGAVTFLSPGITALAWVFTIAAWAILTGILELIAAFRLRGALGAEVLLTLSGVVSIIFGFVMAALPLIGLVAWVLLIGVYAIAFGVLLLIASFRLRGAAKAPVTTATV